MLFSDLAKAFKRLEETSSRITLIQILADLFRETPPDEIAPTTYLLQGRLAPAFVPLEMGMGLKNVASAIAEAYAIDRDAVLERYDRVGDLGTAAGQLAAESRSSHLAAATLEVHQVFTALLEIARTAGAGSAQGKVSAFAGIISELDPLSVIYLCRIPLGTLRLGVGDVTILDAFSLACTGDRKLRPHLERAYNETSDLGLIGATLWTGGIEAVDALGVKIGNPVRPMLAERLPSAEAILATLGRCSIESKYDGFRCQVHRSGDTVKIFSRNLEEMTDAFPEIVAAATRQLTSDGLVTEVEESTTCCYAV